MTNHHTRSISQEIRKAVTLLGGSTEGVDDPTSGYKKLEKLTDDAWLLATFGTWQDGMDELEVLNFLREWNLRIPNG
jgi:hypothetical protein